MKMLLGFLCLVGWSCQEAKVTGAGPDNPQQQAAEEGIISSINRDWGFLIVKLNSGSAWEVEDSIQLNTRSGETFGEVRVFAVEEDQVIVELPLGSSTLNHQPMVGDLVVLAP